MRDSLALLFIGLTFLFLCVTAETREAPKTFPLEVQITGLQDDALKNALGRIANKQALIEHDVTTTNILRLYHEIPNEISLAIQPFGYFKAHIRSHLERRGPLWIGYFHVIPGPRMRYATVDVSITGEGALNPAFQRFYEKFPIKAGDFLDTQKYESVKQEFYDVASAHGYFDSHLVKNRIYINLTRYVAHVVIHFDTGPRFRFGKTTFSKTPLNPKFLERFLFYQQGDYYSHHKIQQTRAGLANSNYFSTVIVMPNLEKVKNFQVPIDVQLEMQPKKQYTVGAGYGTDTGLRGLLGVDIRWLNQYGHHFNASLVASNINSQVVANYFIPGRNPATELYIFTGGLLSQDQATGKGRSARLAASYQTVFGGWQATASLTALKERYSIVNLPFTTTHLIYPTLTVQRKRTDNPLNPTSGYSIVGQIIGASKDILSETSFLQERLDARYLFSFWERNTRVILRATVGHTSIKDLVSLPLSLQLFTGGAQSLRGFGYNSIGPGRNMFVGSVEIQQRIAGNFYLAGFFDFGNVADQLTRHKLKEGVGPGLVWLSPIGMFELTFANAISEPKRPWVIQFSMGSVL